MVLFILLLFVDKIQRAIQVNGLLSTLLEFVNETSFRVDRDDNEKGDDDEEEKVDLKQLQKRVAKIISLVTMNGKTQRICNHKLILYRPKHDRAYFVPRHN